MKKRNRADITEMVQRVYFQKVLESKNDADFLAKISDVIKRIELLFPYIPLKKICSRVSLRRNIDRYAKNWPVRRAAEYSNELLGTSYTLGSQGFMAWLVGGDKPKPVAMFKKSDLKRLKRLGKYIPIDYKHHKQKFVIDKLDYMLSAFNMGYHKILRAGKITSPNVL